MNNKISGEAMRECAEIMGASVGLSSVVVYGKVIHPKGFKLVASNSPYTPEGWNRNVQTKKF